MAVSYTHLDVYKRQGLHRLNFKFLVDRPIVWNVVMYVLLIGGGECQRILIARALAQQTPVILDRGLLSVLATEGFAFARSSFCIGFLTASSIMI